MINQPPKNRPTPRLIYQIYPSAVGDLRDISAKLPLIAKLQPDYLALTPIFAGPWFDDGYDVADYRRIDPRFGKLSDFHFLVRQAETYGIKILLTLVLNHSSVQHPWFRQSVARLPQFRDYYVWQKEPFAWDAFVGGPAFSYNAERGEYYLHLFNSTQPDLNFENPAVVEEFRQIIAFWKAQGAGGFMVDSANVLVERHLRKGIMPRLGGFLNFYQSAETLDVLELLFSDPALFNVAEPVGGHAFTKKHLRQLTAKAFNASFGASIPQGMGRTQWLKEIASWSPDDAFALQLESPHCTRATTRFHADPHALAMLLFTLPVRFPCIYQGQELGTACGDPADSRAPVDWGEYILQAKNPASTLNVYLRLLKLWREDPVLRDGTLKVAKIDKKGVINFERCLGDRRYFIHIDLENRSASFIRGADGRFLLRLE